MKTWQIQRGDFTITPLRLGGNHRVTCPNCGGRVIKHNVVDSPTRRYFNGDEKRRIYFECVSCGERIEEKQP